MVRGRFRSSNATMARSDSNRFGSATTRWKSAGFPKADTPIASRQPPRPQSAKLGAALTGSFPRVMMADMPPQPMGLRGAALHLVNQHQVHRVNSTSDHVRVFQRLEQQEAFEQLLTQRISKIVRRDA